MIDTSLPYCVYRTSHPSGFYYIGKSQTIKVISQRYQGSGIRLATYFNSPEYHPSTWTTEIIANFNTEAEAYDYERELVTVEMLTDPHCVNDQTGGKSGNTRSELIGIGELSRDCFPSRTLETVKVFDAELNGRIQQCVDARDLHAVMCVATNINTWIKKRIDSYNFVEGVDWVYAEEPAFTKNKPAFEDQKAGVNKGGAGLNKKDYTLTLDMAKNLSMVERTPKGQEARNYFISIEKKYYAQVLHQLEETKPLTNQERAIQLITDSIQIGSLFGLSTAESGLKIAPRVRKETSINILPFIRASLKKQ